MFRLRDRGGGSNRGRWGILLCPDRRQRPHNRVEEWWRHGIAYHFKPPAHRTVGPDKIYRESLQCSTLFEAKPSRDTMMFEHPLVGVHAPEGRAHGMQWDVSPVGNNTGARLAPVSSSFAGQIVPVKLLRAEFSDRPCRHSGQDVLLSQVRRLRIWSVGRSWERVVDTQVASDPNHEQASPRLWNTEVLGIQDSPFYPVTC